MTDPVVPPDEFRSRQAVLAEAARERELDAILVWSSAGSALDAFGHVFYLTNHYSPVPRVNVDIPPFMTGWGQAAAVVTAEGETILVAENGDYRRDLVVADRVRHSRDLHAEVVATLRDVGAGAGRVGVAGVSCLPLAAWRTIAAELPRARFEFDADAQLYRQRALKSPTEVELMRRASAVGCEIQNRMLPLAVPGRTDADLAAEGYRTCCEHGAVPWEFAFASGPHSAHGYWCRLPAWDRTRRYVAGDLVHPDAYGGLDGYLYDIQRTVVVGGEPPPRLEWLLEGVVGVVEELCGLCRPGTPAAEIANHRDRWLSEYGYEDPTSTHPEQVDAGEVFEELAAVGHGLGLGFELPWIDSASPWVLEPSMTIALEVYLSDPDYGTVAFEHTVLVTDSEPEILTSGCPSRWW